MAGYRNADDDERGEEEDTGIGKESQYMRDKYTTELCRWGSAKQAKTHNIIAVNAVAAYITLGTASCDELQ